MTKIFTSYEEFLKRSDKDLNGISQEFADKNPNYNKENESNKGCWNCSKCYNCFGCYNSFQCYNCFQCYKCFGCYRCSDCYNSSDCFDCYNCWNCFNCFNCLNKKNGLNKYEEIEEFSIRAKEFKDRSLNLTKTFKKVRGLIAYYGLEYEYLDSPRSHSGYFFIKIPGTFNNLSVRVSDHLNLGRPRDFDLFPGTYIKGFLFLRKKIVELLKNKK